jgi:hypothetical protein
VHSNLEDALQAYEAGDMIYISLGSHDLPLKTLCTVQLVGLGKSNEETIIKTKICQRLGQS